MTATSTEDNEGGGGATNEGGTPDAGVGPPAVKPQPTVGVAAGDDPAAAGGDTTGDPTTGQTSRRTAHPDPKSVLIRAMICGGLLVFSVLGILISSGKASWCNSGAATVAELYNPNVASTCSSVTEVHMASVVGAIIFGVVFLTLGVMAMSAREMSARDK
jgi:hypothetical protein